MKKILIIDDDEIILNTLGIYLADEGFTILSTADGPQGILMYRNEQPDVVILDLGLPSLDGREVLSRILSYDPKAKVIIITGYVSPQIMEETLRNGAFGFFSKPFDIVVLIEKINAGLELR